MWLTIEADRLVREPSWIVTNRRNGHSHAMWTLKVPVHRYPQARQKPLLLFRRVNEFYLKATNADPVLRVC